MNQNDALSPQNEPVIVDNAAREKDANRSRRTFLFKVSLVANGVVGAVLAVPIFGYLLGSAMRKTSADESWINIGTLDQFPEGETRLATFRNPVTTAWDGQTGNVPCWVRHVSGNKFQVFAINCAHLGCPVRWFSESKLFLCPCHGGAYYENGARASGPPERGLFEYGHKLLGNALMISAGKMPTLASKVATPAPLTQIAGSSVTGLLAAVESVKPGCGSCQG